MTTTQKVALVRGAEGSVSLSVALSIVDLPRSTWYYQAGRRAYEIKHASLKAPLLKIASAFPEYGYRRSTDELSERVGYAVNHKVVQKLARIWGLAAFRRPRAPRVSTVRRTIAAAGDRANLLLTLDHEPGIFEVLVTDFTELVCGAGKAWLMAIEDSRSKLVVGHAVSRSRNRAAALAAWRQARRTLRGFGVAVAGVIVHHDRDSVYTSEEWVRRLLIEDQVRLSYALRGARDNAAMESFNGRFKGENRELFAEAETFDHLVTLVAKRKQHYNSKRRHSSLGNMTPRAYVLRHLGKESSQ
jgi:transposase InsO family protein